MVRLKEKWRNHLSRRIHISIPHGTIKSRALDEDLQEHVSLFQFHMVRLKERERPQ